MERRRNTWILPESVRLRLPSFHDKRFCKMNKAVVFGNGEWAENVTVLDHQMFGVPVVTWGCNAIYRNGKVDKPDLNS